METGTISHEVATQSLFMVQSQDIFTVPKPTVVKCALT